MNQKKLSQSGIGLIETIIGIGLIGLVAVGVASVLNGGSKSSSHISQKDTVNSMANAVIGTFSDPTLCSATFVGQNGMQANTNLSALANYKIGQDIGNKTLIKKISFNAPTLITGTTNFYTATVTYSFDTSAGNQGSLADKSFTVYYQTDASGTISCLGNTKNLQAPCQIMGGSWSNGICTLSTSTPTPTPNPSPSPTASPTPTPTGTWSITIYSEDASACKSMPSCAGYPLKGSPCSYSDPRNGVECSVSKACPTPNPITGISNGTCICEAKEYDCE